MRLTAEARKKMPASKFGMPATKGYPMPDKAHARLAKSGASRAEHVGNISAATKARIDAKADRVLGHTDRGHTNVRNAKTHADKLRHC